MENSYQGVPTPQAIIEKGAEGKAVEREVERAFAQIIRLLLVQFSGGRGEGKEEEGKEKEKEGKRKVALEKHRFLAFLLSCFLSLF